MPPPIYVPKKPENDSNQFLCKRGQMVSVHRQDTDRNPLPDTLQSYSCTSKTSVPFEILNTGNTDVLNRYLSAHSKELTALESSHLTDRIDVMNYLGELEKYFQNTERVSVGPMTVNSKMQKVLPGIVLDRRQDTNLGCWSCAFSMLLKGRGVNIDQRLIRRYRPEFVEGNEINSPQQTDIINSDEMSEIYQYSSLVDKVCPNTRMCKMSKGGQHGANNSQIMAQITRALREKNAPVAFCNGSHWTTIVGISDDNKTFYVVNSMNKQGGQIDEVPADIYLKYSKAEFVWLEDIVLDKDGRSEALPENRFRLDKKSGAVITRILGDAEPGGSAMSTRGNHVVDREAHMEYYVPTMIRDYSRSYEEQNAESNQYLKENGGFMPPVPKVPVYTYASDYSAVNVEKQLNKMVESNVFGDRKSSMRDAGYFTQAEIDGMTPEMADRCYDYIKKHPGCPEVPLVVQYPEIADDYVAPAPQEGEKLPAEEKEKSFPANNSPAQDENEFTLFDKNDDPVTDKNDFTLFGEGVPAAEGTAKAVSDSQQQANEYTIFSGDAQPADKNDSPVEDDDLSVHESGPIPEEDDGLEVYTGSEDAQDDTKDYAEIIAEQRKCILQCAKLLKSSKTLVNSNEYKGLIALMEKVGKGETKLIEGKTPKEQMAQELYAIHIHTEKYLEHKAKDGVKRNTYRKLLAVEKTNSMLKKCIVELGDVKVKSVSGEEKGLLTLPVSLEDRNMSLGTNIAPTANFTELANKFKEQHPECEKIKSSVIAEGIHSVDVCMCEIMIKARNNPAAMSSLESVRQHFLDNPFPPAKETVEVSVHPKEIGKTI